jgi:lipid-A-disaccharide synthase
MPDKEMRIMIVAGEASGDLHAAKLVRALREAAPDHSIQFFGAAGPRMREEGVEPIVVSDELTIVGLLEIGRALPIFFRALPSLKRAAADRKPDVAVLVDFPDFNLKLAKALKKRGVKIVYYISPQLWAWRSYRVRSIKKYVDLLITILPFEKDWYRSKGVTNVEYVGSPLATEVRSNSTKEGFCQRHGLDPQQPIIALLPGSRSKEISRILPVMVDAMAEMTALKPEIQFIIAAANCDAEARIQAVVEKQVKVIAGETYDILNAADAAAVTSGTATLETAIIGTPLAIVYKTSALNYKLLRPLISVEHFGLVNLIAGKRIAKELIQNEFTPESLSTELARLLKPAENEIACKDLAGAVEKLGHGGASMRAAKAILKTVGPS